MSEEEVNAWVQLLGKTREQRIAALIELLRFSRQDALCREDRVICRAQLERLKQEHYGWRTH